MTLLARYRSAECDVPVPGIFHFLVVSEPVSEKIGIGKKSRNRYRSNLVSEKSLGTGIGKNWYRKKYRYRYRKYLVPEKSIGIGMVQHFGYRHTLTQTLEGTLLRLITPFYTSQVSN